MLVDVGAHHGGSVRQFCRAGWTVHAFEPDPANRRILVQNADADWSLHINEEAIAEVDGATVDFFASPESTGVSGLSPFLSSHERVAQVQTVRLSTYLERVGIGHVDYLKIDTEGHDLFVLKSFPWDRDTPDAIECEFEDNKTLALGYSSEELAEFLIDKGYQVLISEWHPIVRYGISHDFHVLRKYERGTISGSAWGNFMAVRPAVLDSLIIEAKERGADIREEPAPTVNRGVSVYPNGYPNSPSAVPLIAGDEERAAASPQTLGASHKTKPANEKAPSVDVPVAGRRSASDMVVRLAKRISRFYAAPTGMVLGLALLLIAIGFFTFDFSWLVGVLGVAGLAVFLPFKFSRMEERQFSQSSNADERAKRSGLAAKQAQFDVAALQNELRQSIQRLENRIEREVGGANGKSR